MGSSDPPNILVGLRFTKASEVAKSLLASAAATAIPLEQRTRWYALYKQATRGDCRAEKPPFYNAIARARWDVWDDLRGLGREQAKAQYIEAILEALRELPETDSHRAALHELAPREPLLSLSFDPAAELGLFNHDVPSTFTEPDADSVEQALDPEQPRDHPEFRQAQSASNQSSPVMVDTGRITGTSPSHSPASGSPSASSPTTDTLSEPRSPDPTIPSATTGELATLRTVGSTQSLAVGSQQLAAAIEANLAAETERTLISLQTQVIALNERIDMLRRELTQSQREVESRITSWRAVIRSSLRHFIVNFALLALVFLFPYWRRAPGVNRAAEALKRFIVFVLTFLPQRWQLTRFIEQRFRRTIYRIPSH